MDDRGGGNERVDRALARWTAYGVLGALIGITGCGDDGMATTESASSDSGDTTEQDPVTPDPTTSTTTPMTPADSDSSDDGPAPLELDVQIYTYPNQPMVVDVSFSAPDLELTLEEEDDPGIRVGPVEGAEGETWMRVRGLAPEAGHFLNWTAVDGQGREAAGDLLVTTEAPLPGFVPSFRVEEDSAGGYGGYVLFDLLALTPRTPASLFVVDTDGITRWHIGRNDAVAGPPAVFAGAKQRPDGTILFLRDYSIFVMDEMGVEEVTITSEQLGLAGLHHDVIELENGNFLSMSYTFRDIEYPDIGLTHVAGDLIVEITPEGEIVWEWDTFDYLDPLRRRENFDDIIIDPDTLEAASDWTHGNGLVYDPRSDTVMLSLRHQDWIVLVDHATGDLMWRLGEEGDFMLLDGTWPYHQHSPEWQEDGTLLLYDNGVGNPGLEFPMETSRAVRYALDTRAMTATQVWEDEAEDFVSIIAGDADRLPDGSVLITDSSIGLELGPDQVYARVREVDEDSSDSPQWSFTTELGTFIYRCTATALLPGESP